MDYFLSHIDAGYVFPMHLWEQYSVIAQYKERKESREWRERIMEIQYPGQEFVLP